MDDATQGFSLDHAFTEMRRRHAKECHDFVVAYQRQCVKHFEDEAHVTRQRIKLEDLLTSWFSKNASVLTHDVRCSSHHLAMQFADLTFRTEQPKAVARHEKEQDQKQKQRESLIKAEAEYRLMDVNKLLATAVLEFGALQGRSSSARQRVLPKDGALAYLSKQHPGLAKKYNLVVGKKGSSNLEPKAQQNGHRGRSSSKASKASSTKSAGAGSARSKSSRSSKTPRSASRQSATSSKSKTNSNRQPSSQPKGRGKGKGRGGNRKQQPSRAVRVQTPAPPRRR